MADDADALVTTRGARDCLLHPSHRLVPEGASVIAKVPLVLPKHTRREPDLADRRLFEKFGKSERFRKLAGISLKSAEPHLQRRETLH